MSSAKLTQQVSTAVLYFVKTLCDGFLGCDAAQVDAKVFFYQFFLSNSGIFIKHRLKPKSTIGLVENKNKRSKFCRFRTQLIDVYCIHCRH